MDDSDYEIGKIRAMLPDVVTIKADYTELSFVKQIIDLFGEQSSPNSSQTQCYKEEKDREKSKLSCSSAEEYNRSLETKFTCAIADLKQIERFVELSQKTNQFNLSGKEYSKEAIQNLIHDKNYIVLYLSVSDKYGNMGIVGASIIKLSEQKAIIESFFLSCCVFGRGFETILLDKVKTVCESKELLGIFVKTDKNSRHREFYTKNGVNLYE